MQLVNRKTIAVTALAFAITQALTASAADFGDVSSTLGNRGRVAPAALNPAALARAQQRFAQVQHIADLYAAQYKNGPDNKLDPRRAELINNLMRGDARGLAEAVSAPSLKEALVVANDAKIRGTSASTVATGRETSADSIALPSASATEELVYTPIAPCRIVDTRYIPSFPGAPLGDASTTSFFGTGSAAQRDPAETCVAYTGTTPAAMVLNVTIDSTTVSGYSNAFMSVYPGGSSPLSSWMNYSSGQEIANE